MTVEAVQQFLSLCAAGDLARLQLTRPPDDAGAVRVQMRPVQLKTGPHWQVVWKHPAKDLSENWPSAQAPERLSALFAAGWRSAAVWTSGGHWQIDRHRNGQWKLVRHASGVALPITAEHNRAHNQAHNRSKDRPLDLAHPAWLALGVTALDRSGAPQLVPAMARKWKQINHFVALFEQAIEDAGLNIASESRLRVADFGCGRGYLTFAVALWLAQRGIAAQVLGVELRDDLVAQTETLARQLPVEGLRFSQGNVGQQEVEPLDVMIALHACDTATDHAIHHGVRAGARVILCAPCCHKELRGQLQPPSALRPLFRHGIHLGQEAEMLTDGLRALWLESLGYEAKVIEFVSLEHTQKNKMIVAVRRLDARPEQAAEALVQADALKAFWQIRQHSLERLLRGF